MQGKHLILIPLAALLLAAACGTSDPEATPDPIITITNSWTDEDDPEHSFQFNSADDGEDSGSFEGEETLPDHSEHDLEGSWEGGWLEFTVDRPQPVTWSGPFEDDTDRLELHSDTEGDLVIVRD